MSYILVSTARGYVFFSRTNDGTLNGLLFLQTAPDGADVYINGRKEQDTTPSKLSLADGVYTITFKKNGYADWSKDLSLRGGEVSFVTYPRLTPTSLSTSVINTSTSYVPQTSQSRDKRWIIFHQESSLMGWQVYDLEHASTPPTVVTLPIELFGDNQSPVVSASVVEWAEDNTHLLFKYLLQSGQVYYFVCSRASDASACQNLTAYYGLPADSTLGLWDGKWDQYYIIDSAQNMRRAELKSPTLSGLVVPGKVTRLYALSDERFVFATAVSDTKTEVKLYTKSRTITLGSFDAHAEDFVFASAGFNRNEYVAVGAASLPKTYVFKNPLKTADADAAAAPSILLPMPSTSLAFSSGNRFLFAAGLTQHYVYDFERKQQQKVTFDHIESPMQIGWVDASRLFVLGSDQQLWFTDFDGDNAILVAQKVKAIPRMTESGDTISYIAESKGIINMFGAPLLSTK